MSFILIYSFRTHRDEMPLMISVALWWAHTSTCMCLSCWGAQNWHSTSRVVSPALSREGGSWSDGSTPPDEAQECCWLSWQQGHNAVSYSVHWPQVPFLFYKMWFILGMGKIVQISPHSTHFKTHCRHSKFRVSLYEKVQNELLSSPSPCELDPVMT